jgi:HK97 family phage prohead protease
MKKAFSVFDIKSASEGSNKRTFRGIATTPATDRVQDIVEPKGAVFKLPIPLLWQHDSGDPIGWITGAKVTDKGIEVEGEVADIPESGALKDRLLNAWQMLKHKLVRGLSIGFNPLEYADIAGTWGTRYTKWEWLELSAVTIPANQEATITTIKSAALGHKKPPGVSGRPMGDKKMTLQEQLFSLKEARGMKAARLAEITESIRAKNATADDLAEFDSLTVEIEQADNDIRLKTAEIVVAGTAQPVQPVIRTGPTIHVKSVDQEEKFPGQNFTRQVIAKAIAHMDGVSPLAVAEHRWGKTNPTLVNIIKTAVAGGGAPSGEWGTELVQADTRYTGDFLQFLYSKTVFDRLPLREVPANVTIKGQDGAATGYWVGESQPIPLSAQSFSTVNLSPLKVAALAVVSNELLRDSTPAAEMLVRDALVEASSQRVDSTFLSTAAAVSNVSPAGLFRSLSPVAGSAGTDADGLRADVIALYAPFLSAKNASGLYFVMNPALAKAIQLLTNALGVAEFPGINQDGGTLLGDPVVTGDNVNAAYVVLLKPSDIYRIGDLGVQISISREATIEMDDAPTGEGLGPTGASKAMVNMFQSENTAIKIVRPINYALRRAGVVQIITDAAYGTATS